MPEPNWQYVLPCDFSDPFQIELFGWVKTKAYDLAFTDQGIYMRNAVGSADPLHKYATQIWYRHEELGIEVATINYFDKGVVYILWYPTEQNETNFATGRAIKVNGRWRVVQKDQIFFYSGIGKKLINNVLIIVKFGLSIHKKVTNQPIKEIYSIEIHRDL